MIKFHENPSNSSRVFPCGQTDMTKLIVAFRYFANAPKNEKQEDRLSIFVVYFMIIDIFNKYFRIMSKGKPRTTIWHTCASKKRCKT